MVCNDICVFELGGGVYSVLRGSLSIVSSMTLQLVQVRLELVLQRFSIRFYRSVPYRAVIVLSHLSVKVLYG